MAFRILIVDDEIEMCRSLSELLRARGYGVQSTTTPAEVPSLLDSAPPDLILMDVKMPAKDGITLLREVKEQRGHIPVIMVSGYASPENIVRAMKYGAANFYEKPLRMAQILKEVDQLARAAGARKDPTPGMPVRFPVSTANPVMQEIYRTIAKVAPTDASVVITGESGTGKELVADSLHALSPRRDRAFVKINCAAIPAPLMESELFGHEEGAFTDARKLHRGKFEIANGGSLFLDEIGELGPETQAKLLRVLQDRELVRLGGSDAVGADVRIIAATNKDIDRLVSGGQFRQDLYYRLSVIGIALPPLRERKEDVSALAEYFLAQFCQLYTKPIHGFSPEVQRIFQGHQWPGNVRELKNCIERAVIFCETSVIGVVDLPRQYTQYMVKERDSLESAYEDISRQMILDALEKTSGAKQKAADLLRIHRKTLYNKMKKLGMEP